MYYPCSENKDADQLRGYREADLRLCFRPCKLLVFSRTGSYDKTIIFTRNLLVRINTYQIGQYFNKQCTFVTTVIINSSHNNFA